MVWRWTNMKLKPELHPAGKHVRAAGDRKHGERFWKNRMWRWWSQTLKLCFTGILFCKVTNSLVSKVLRHRCKYKDLSNVPVCHRHRPWMHSVKKIMSYVYMCVCVHNLCAHTQGHMKYIKGSFQFMTTSVFIIQCIFIVLSRVWQ